MPGAVIANWPIALLIVVAIVGVPLLLTFRRKHVQPTYRDARAHYEAKEAGTASGEYVPAERVSSLDGLTVPRQPGTGSTRSGAMAERVTSRPDQPGDHDAAAGHDED